MFYGINKVISDEMARCWTMLGRGNSRVFSISKKERQCFVCSTIFFDTNIDITFIEPYPDLLLSLMTEKDRSRYRVLPKILQDVELETFSGTENISVYRFNHV
jgi:hypothetical protein